MGSASRAHPLRTLSILARTHAALLLAGQPEPHVELLTLLWDARFDRAHAQALVERAPAATPAPRAHLRDAAECFDRLPACDQQRLRRLVLRHWRARRATPTATIAPCTASC